MSIEKNKEKITATENNESKLENSDSEKLKTCFIIMPIADHPDYEAGHFDRVYNYLIKPACLNAGYRPIRADDSKASNMIMFDILKKIVECDMAICDLSSRNANVFYELGLRQAFNKKTILITDNKQPTPFDISSFRYLAYSPSLRVDTVNKEVPAISLMLKETENASEDDLNSIVKLLQIRPAKVDSIDLTKEESVIYNLLMKMQSQISRLSLREQNPNVFSNSEILSTQTKKLTSVEKENLVTFELVSQILPQKIYDLSFRFHGDDIGNLSTITEDELIFNLNGNLLVLPNNHKYRNEITAY
jgi:hypothetical protein